MLFVMKKRGNMLTEVDKNIFLSGCPTPSDAEAMSGKVRYIVCLQEEREQKTSYPFRSTESCLRLPTRDYTSPSEEDISKAVSYIKEKAGRGGVLVHCKSGKGRSVACAIAFLCETKGHTFETAYALLRSKRKITRKGSASLRTVRQKYTHCK